MTDEKQIDPLTARVAKINGAVLKLSELAFEAMTAPESARASRQDTVETIQAMGILVGSIVVALSEIADNVGKIARQGEKDIAAAIAQAAEVKAAEQVAETNRRSFIGQQRKSD